MVWYAAGKYAGKQTVRHGTGRINTLVFAKTIDQVRPGGVIAFVTWRRKILLKSLLWKPIRGRRISMQKFDELSIVLSISIC